MIAKNSEEFEALNQSLDAAPAFQVIADGNAKDVIVSFEFGVGAVNVEYLIDTLTIRMNHTALNEWILSEVREDAPENYGYSPEEWEEKQAERRQRRASLIEMIRNDLGYEEEGFNIKQITAEFFGIVYIKRT